MPRNETNRVPGFYFKSQPLEFMGEDTAKKRFVNRYISAEIEVNKAVSGHALMPLLEQWKCSTVYDNSLASGTGFEICTSPQKGEGFPNLISKIGAALQIEEAKVGDNCGLHVHVDTRDLTFKQLFRVIKLYTHIEPALFSLQPMNRRVNHTCEPFNSLGLSIIEKAKAFPEDQLEGLLGCVAYNMDRELGFMQTNRFPGRNIEFIREEFAYRKTDKYGGQRYRSLNIPSHFHRGTVECRLHCGTVKPKEISNWGLLFGAIVDKGSKMADEEIDSLEMSDLSKTAKPDFGSPSYYCGNSDFQMSITKGWPSFKPAWETLLKIAPYGTKYYFSTRRKKFEKIDEKSKY